jgi:glyoxylase-like metal-dependent hydrolase (beta-lactamase superfamily II)
MLAVENLQSIALPPAYAPFVMGFDLFGDASLLAVELPGHAIGQLGLFLAADDRHYFLIADACWLSRAYQEFVEPHPIARLIFADNRQYVDTLAKIHQLHQLNPHLKIIPTHCAKTWRQLSGRSM